MAIFDHSLLPVRPGFAPPNGRTSRDGATARRWILAGKSPDRGVHAASTPAYGIDSSNVLYVEDNYFTNITSGDSQACDGWGGGRMVFRHNIVLNDTWGDHGTETGGRVRSLRSFEVYDNVFSAPTQSWGYAVFTANYIRGGCGVFFSNTINGYRAAVSLRDYRLTDTFYNQWEPFGGADGTNPWDSNTPTPSMA